MSHKTVCTMLALSLCLSLQASAVDVYSGPKIISAPLATDQRTDFERLEDRVNELAFLVEEAHAIIILQRQQIKSLQSAQKASQGSLTGLLSKISVSDNSIVLSASTVKLEAAQIDLSAPLTKALGEIESSWLTAELIQAGTIECDNIIADDAAADSYQPGAGNVF